MNKIVFIILLLTNIPAYSFTEKVALDHVITDRFKGFLDAYDLGDHTGNGGDVVVCEQSGKKSYRVLDYYEVTELHFMQPQLAAHSTKEGYLEEIVNRLSDKKIKKEYLERAAHFMSRIKWTKSELQDVPDSQHTFIPSDCALKQIAINHLNGRITINKNLWNKLDPLNQAVLILHELIYEDAILSGVKDSVSSRYVLAQLISNKKIYIENEMMKSIKMESSVQSLEDYERVIHFSPFSKLRSWGFERIIEGNYKLNIDFSRYFLSLAKSSDFGIIYRALRETSFHGLNKYLEGGNGTTLIKSIEINLNYLSKLKKFSIDQIENIFSEINSTELDKYIEGSFQDVLNILEYSITLEKGNPSVIGNKFFELLRYISNNAHLIDTQEKLNQILAMSESFKTSYGFFNDYTRTLRQIHLYLTVPSFFVEKYYSRISEVMSDGYRLPQKNHLAFFVLRGLHIDKIVDVFKILLSKDRYIIDRSKDPFYWILNEEDTIFSSIAALLRKELQEAVTYRGGPGGQHDWFRINAYYDFFEGKTESEHIDYVLEEFLNGNDELMEWLILRRGDRSLKIQNAIAYRMRYDNGSYKYQYIRLLSQFDSFSPFSESVINLELKKNRNNIYTLKRLLELFINERQYSNDTKKILEFYLDHQNKEVVEMVKMILHKN